MLRLRQMQSASNRNSEGARHTHRIVFLHPGDGVADLRRKDAIDLPAIISETPQVSLQGSHVSGLVLQVMATFQIVERTPMVAGRSVGRVKRGALMKQAILIAGGQRIIGMENPDVV